MVMRQMAATLKDAFDGWVEDEAASMGAALAFYTLFSMAPLLLLVIAIAGLVIGADTARSLIFDQLEVLLGPRGAAAVQAVLTAAHDPARGAISAAVSLATLAVGATTVLAELRRDLDRIWKQPRRSGGLKGLLRARLKALGLVLTIGFLLMVSLALSATVTAVGSAWSGLLPGTAMLLRGLEFTVSFVLVTGLFAMIYKILPSVSLSWGDVWIGAAATSLLFWAGKWLIGLYIAKSAVASPFGAAGTLVVVILWVYYSAQIFFFGAEFTRAYALRRGSLSGPPAA